MSTRNPMNERNTVEGKKAGVTRKSAASAKPATKAAASVRVQSSKPEKKGLFGGSSSSSTSSTTSKSKKKETENGAASKAEVKAIKRGMNTDQKSARKADRQRRRAIQSFVPDTPEFKRLNRKRLIYSAIGFVGMILAIVLSFVIPDQIWYSIGVMVVAWVFFFVGVRIDTQELRPLRERGYAQYERKMERKASKKKKK